MSSTWLTVVRTDPSRVWTSSWIHSDAKWIINVNCLRCRRGKSQKCKATGDFDFSVLCFFRLSGVELLTARVGAPSLADTAERRSCFFFFFFPPLQLLLLREADAPDATAHAEQTTCGWPRHGTAQQALLELSLTFLLLLLLLLTAHEHQQARFWWVWRQETAIGQFSFLWVRSRLCFLCVVVHDEMCLWGFLKSRSHYDKELNYSGHTQAYIALCLLPPAGKAPCCNWCFGVLFFGVFFCFFLTYLQKTPWWGCWQWTPGEMGSDN